MAGGLILHFSPNSVLLGVLNAFSCVWACSSKHFLNPPTVWGLWRCFFLQFIIYYWLYHIPYISHFWSASAKGEPAIAGAPHWTLLAHSWFFVDKVGPGFPVEFSLNQSIDNWVNKIEIPSTTGFTACHEQFPSPRVAIDVARFSLGVRHLGSTLQTIGEREGISGLMAGWLPRLFWNGLIVGSILGLCRQAPLCCLVTTWVTCQSSSSWPPCFGTSIPDSIWSSTWNTYRRLSKCRLQYEDARAFFLVGVLDRFEDIIQPVSESIW